MKCWCGGEDTDYAKHGESTGCTGECGGNPDETCGGFYAFDVYAYLGETTPPPTAIVPVPPEPLGCFGDKKSDRIMELALSDPESMTKEVRDAGRGRGLAGEQVLAAV